jgi:hypothetical protein
VAVIVSARRRAGGRFFGVVLVVLIGAAAAWQHGAGLAGLLGARRTAPSDGAALAAAALAEVCTTPTQLPRRSAVAARPVRDPFAPGVTEARPTR